jgi:iron complex transport system ATP-binding protein
MTVPRHELRAEGLTLGYGDGDVVRGLDVLVPDRRITTIVGANASGKSTLLRGLARLLRPRAGAVILDGKAMEGMRTIEVARVLGLLPQAPVSPDGITVGDLVGRGRYPHQGWFRQWGRADDEAVAAALESTGIADLVGRRVDELSGGQRQRVWIAMVLAQETDVLLLDEPTAHLDLAHQVEVLDLLTELNRARGRTILLVLHDLNHAARYAHHLLALRDGRIVAQGTPGEVVTEALVTEVFGLDVRVVEDPVAGTPMVVPVGRHLEPTAARRAEGNGGTRRRP